MIVRRLRIISRIADWEQCNQCAEVLVRELSSQFCRIEKGYPCRAKSLILRFQQHMGSDNGRIN